MRIAVFVAAGLAVLTSFLHAQSDDDDDDMDYFPLVPTGSSLRFGMRYVGGPKVAFHNVGNVPATNVIADATIPTTRVYNDGGVSIDTRTDSSGRPVNDGLTNNWTLNYDSQITAGGDVAYHLYSSDLTGNTIKGKTSTAAGWELQAGRSMGKIARKVDVSFVGGFTFSGINAKRSSEVTAQLTTLTDTYSLNGQVPPTVPYTAPTTAYRNVFDSNGAPVLGADGSQTTQTVDTSILLAQNPTRTITTRPAQVSGHWQIKGAYYTFRAGPVFQMPVTERLKLSIGFGAGAIVVGSTYKSDQEIVVDDITARIMSIDEKTRTVLLPAFYADADAEYWLTERTGFYLGATYQKSKSFDQTLDASSATVNLGSTSGVQSGLTLRF